MRQLKAAPVQFREPLVRRIGLQSNPRLDQSNTSGAVLSKTLFSARPPEQDIWRSRYGRALNLNVIERALVDADWGSMRALTDLSRETIDTDPHLASVLNKRFGAISALPVEIIPAEGVGVDLEKAAFYADVVRQQLLTLPDFGARLNQLAWGLFDGRAALEIKWLLVPTVPAMVPMKHPKYGVVSWVVKELGWIHPRRLHFGPEREIRVYDDFVAPGFIEYGVALRDLPCKFIYWTPQLFGDYPEREGLARRALYWSFFKRFSARERMVLIELFGKPFRWLEVDEESSADTEDLAQADVMLQQIGGQSSFRLPRGTKYKIEQPGEGAGDVHQDAIVESDKQISKLVLGQTGTTDANPSGLNNVQANVMQDEQFMILMRDSGLMSEVLETDFSDAIIELNFGSQELIHAPKMRLRADVPLDRNKEIDRLNKTLMAGLEVALAQAYEITGFRIPKPDEPVVRWDTPPLHPLAVQPPPERAVVAWPESYQIPPRKQQPLAPAGEGGLPSPTKPAEPPTSNGEPPIIKETFSLELSPGDVRQPTEITLPFSGFASFDECLSKMKEQGHTQEEAERICGALKRDTESVSSSLTKAHPSDVIVATQILMRGLIGCGDDCCSAVQLANQVDPQVASARQPEESVVGSIETLIERGVRAGAREGAKLASIYAEAGSGKDDPRAILTALENAHDDVDLHAYSRVLERRILHSIMAGAIASQYEYEDNSVLTPAALVGKGDRVSLADVPPADPNFVNKPFAEALKWFKSRTVMTRTMFDKIEAAAKRRAFTIAGVTNDLMLQRAKDELEAIVKAGKDIRDFRSYVEQRMETAGFTTANPSHVETVYRTNIVNAYNSGRYAQATTPVVMRARPYWQIRTVNDGPPRQRASHQAVHLWVLSASDSFWSTAYPPWGFNCRCRVVTMSAKDVSDRGLRVRTGGEVHNLPDPGFTSGVSSLLLG